MFPPAKPSLTNNELVYHSYFMSDTSGISEPFSDYYLLPFKPFMLLSFISVTGFKTLSNECKYITVLGL